MLREPRSGHGAEGAVEGDENAVLLDSEAEQIGFRHLLMAEDAIGEGRGEADPALHEGPIGLSGFPPRFSYFLRHFLVSFALRSCYNSPSNPVQAARRSCRKA